VVISTTTQPATSPNPDNSPPDYFQLTKQERPTSPSDVASNVGNHVDSSETKEDLSTETDHTQDEKLPAVNGGIHSDAMNNTSELSPHEQASVTDKLHSTGESHISVTVTTETASSDQMNGTTNGAVAGTTAASTLDKDSPPSKDAKLSPATRKKKMFGLFGSKQKPRRDSQKPLLNSQSSQTPGDR